MRQGFGKMQGSGAARSGAGGNKKWGDTTSKRGEVSRVFVGNIDSNLTACEDLENKFSAYGNIMGIDINQAGFAFVQFGNVPEALRAVDGENGTMLRGRILEVRMFDKSGPPKRKNPMNRDRSRSPLSPRGPPVHGGLPPPLPHGPPGYGMPGAPPPLGVPGGPPPPPPPAVPGNDIEIIVVNKDQWGYAEMIERTLRQETPIKYIDLLFLHSPQHITLTLNDLYERRTLYAIVVTPINEEHKSITLHILHSQTEHRNIPLDGAIELINQDFHAFMSRRGGPDKPFDPVPFRSGGGPEHSGLPPRGPGMLSNGSTSATYSTSVAASVTSTGENRLPDEISYLLRTTLSEGGVQFLSLQQIDSIIEYFSRERDRLTSQARQQQLRTQSDQGSHSQSYGQEPFQQQPPVSAASGNAIQSNVGDSASNLLDNPHVKAALNSLLQIGAIGGSSGGAQNANLNSLASNLVGSFANKGPEGLQQVTSAAPASTSDAPSYMSTSSSSNMGPGGHQVLSGTVQQTNIMNPNLRRHPLLGTEIGSANNPMNSYSGMGGMQMRPPVSGSSHRGYSGGGQRY